MSVAQPQSNDLLSSPPHSTLHRIIAADTAAPNQSLVVASDGRVGIRDQHAGDLPTWFTYFKTQSQTQDILYILPATPGAAGTFLKNDGSQNLSWDYASSAMIVGNAVVGGGANRVLFEDASQNLATSSGFTYNSVTGDATIGGGNTASGGRSFAAGDSCAATGSDSVALGNGNQASSDGAVALGNTTQATNTGAFSWGQNSVAGGVRSMAGGNTCTTGASAAASVALGTASYASGSNAFAMGDNNIRGADLAGLVASGNASFAFGYVSASNKTITATGTASIAIGQDVNSTANNAFALGTGFTNSTASSFAVGYGQKDFTVASGAIAANGTLLVGGDLTISTHNVITDTSTGTKFATATNQKISFYNSTPIVQPSGNILTALTNLGLIATPTIDAGNISTGTLAVARGGTGLGSYTAGDLLVATGTGTIGSVVDVATGSVLVSGGANTVPAYSASPTITTSVTCPLLIGGTAAGSTLTLRSTSGVGTSGADVIFQTGNSGNKEFARFHFDGTFALFGVGKTPTAFCDILGTAPVSVAGTGTTATATMVVVGAPGGATSGTSSPTGGIGGLISEVAGVGGSIPSSSVTGTGVCGAGGAGTWRAGDGGAVNGSSSALVKGGGGGIGTFGGGNGGSANQSSNACTGGNGSAGNFIGGAGGTATSGGGGAGIGGDGGPANLTAGNGAVGSSSSGGGTGGNGAAANVTGGNGANGATTNGNAGGVVIAMGVTGSGAGTAGTGSSITFKSAVTTSLVVCGTIDKNGRWAIGGTNASPTGLLHLAAGSATASTGPLKFTSGTLLTAAEAGVMEFLTDAYYLTTTTGTIRRMIVAGNTGRSAAATAAVASVATYTLGAADATYEVSANVNVTTATAHNFTVTCTYTDETNTARTLTFGFTQLAGATLISNITNITGAGPYESPVFHIRCKASTAITIATTGTFTTVTYNVEGVIKQTA